MKIKDTDIILSFGDITEAEVDAIVNAANSSLLGGGGVDGAIHRKGGNRILQECREIRARQGGCMTGEAVYTTAGLLHAKYVIHTVGPVWNGGNCEESNLLANCYRNSLLLADKLDVKTIAFPNISTGVYHFPKGEASLIALDTIKNYFTDRDSNIIKVFFVCYDKENYDLYHAIMDNKDNCFDSLDA